MKKMFEVPQSLVPVPILFNLSIKNLFSALKNFQA